VYRWLVDANDETAVRLLVDSGDDLVAAGVRDAMRAPDKQRAGVYGTAKQMVGWLTNRAVVRWAVGGEGRREFSPEAFVTSRGTLYSLSKEGYGSAGPLVTALTVAVTEAAEQHASRQAGGRLRVPLVVVLDEAANVCRWGQLPNMYSHYGSRGICVDTLLQSWSQGVEVWGREGMNKLWGAATVRVVGPGVAEADFLDQVSRLGGDFERVTRSTSSGRGGASTSRQTVKERILDPADLAAMPAGRAVVLASGVPPMLIETQPWMSGPHAAAVQASLLRHEPGRTS
jgi:type IV secretory pathway TraG/TraD family ATPase VirD4